MRSRRRGVALAAFIWLTAACSIVFAQADVQAPLRPGRPFRGLFGGVQRDPNRYQSLDLSLSLLGGYDENAAAGANGSGGGLTDPRFGESSGLASVSASLLFEKVHNENSVYASGRTGFRYYPSLTDLNAADFTAAGGFTKRTSRKVHFAGNADFGYQPFFSLLAIPVFPGAGLPLTTADFGFAERPSLVYGTNLETTLDFTRRTHATGSYMFRGFDTVHAEDLGRLRQQNVRGGITRDLSRRVNIGGQYNYDYSDGSYVGPGTTTRSQGGDFTFDYHRTLRSRRAVSFGWSVGYTTIETTAETASRSDSQMTAGVHLSADVGRSWGVNGDYRRGMRRLAGVVDPVFSNDLQGRVGGLVGRRVDLEFSGMYSKGSTNVSTWTGYNSASLTAQVRWAISRSTAIRGDYIYYWYEFPFDVRLPLGVDRRVSRNAVRVGADVWLPLHR